MNAIAAERKSPLQFFHDGRVQRKLVIFCFMIIPMALLVLFTYVPFIKMIQFSFYDRTYLDSGKFVGLKNYFDVFSRSECFGSLAVSLYYMGGAVVQLGLALFFASLMVFKVKGAGVYKACMFFPYLICGIAVGFIFKFFYSRGYVLDTILMMFGMDLEDIPYWLQNQSINNISLVATSVWRYTGQNMVLFLGAMMSVDNDLYEAADLDGAGKWQKFRYIILPSIKTIIVLNLILSISGSLSAFEPPYVITNGTMGTGTYFVIMNRLAHENQKVGLACAMAIVLLAIIVLCTVAQKLFFKYVFTDGADDPEAAAEAKRQRKAAKAARKQKKEVAPV
ncbi:MAG: sugar ABC transporter permease [Clostridiales bacterium]|nr:sugar ABC transporter permease [Clostridiales bacterium]